MLHFFMVKKNEQAELERYGGRDEIRGLQEVTTQENSNQIDSDSRGGALCNTCSPSPRL